MANNAKKPAVHALVTSQSKSGYEDVARMFSVPVSKLIECIGLELARQVADGVMFADIQAEPINLARAIDQARQLDHDGRGRRNHADPIAL